MKFGAWSEPRTVRASDGSAPSEWPAWALVQLTGLGVFWFYGPVLVFGIFPLLDLAVGVDTRPRADGIDVSGIAINTAHELEHKRASLERWLSKAEPQVFYAVAARELLRNTLPDGASKELMARP
jgi:hypothetical protein